MEHVTTLVSTQRVVALSGAGDRTGPSTRPPAAAGSVEAAAQQPAWIWVLINWWCLFISWGHFICGVEQTNYVSPLVNYHTCSSEIRSSEGNQNRHHVSARVLSFIQTEGRVQPDEGGGGQTDRRRNCWCCFWFWWSELKAHFCVWFRKRT